MKRKVPACCTPSTQRTFIEAPFASGAPRVTVPTESDELKPPPALCDGGDSSVVPRTRTVPLLVETITSDDVIRRKAAHVAAAGNVVMSITRKRRRVILPPVLLVNVRLISRVPKVPLGTPAKLRTRFGADDDPTAPSSNAASNELRVNGALEFSGPGAPRRCPAPTLNPLLSTKTKSVALSFASFGMPSCVHAPFVVIDPPLPHMSRTKA